MLHKFSAADITNTTPSSPITPQIDEAIEGVFQIKIIGTATVVLEGRAMSDAPWIQIDSFTASAAKIVALMAEMRLNPTANTGSVNAWLDTANRG